MVLAITVTIGEEEVALDINEAKELYEDLKRLFDGRPVITMSQSVPTSNGYVGLSRQMETAVYGNGC